MLGMSALLWFSTLELFILVVRALVHVSTQFIQVRMHAESYSSEICPGTTDRKMLIISRIHYSK
jgi:hypothetical protein